MLSKVKIGDIIMKTELEIAYNQSKLKLKETQQFISRLKDLTWRIGPVRYAIDVRKELEDLIKDFERKMQP